MTILQSASKIAFLALIMTACVSFMAGVAMGKVQMDNKDFMVLASGGAAFYFAHKGDENLPYAGK